LRHETLELRTLLSVTVATDLDDYAPGETATITASGFLVGEAVELQVLHIDEVPNTGIGHDSWQVIDGGPDDLDRVMDGNVQTRWVVNEDDSLGSRFEVTATGLFSGEVATTQFTDWPWSCDHYSSISIGSPRMEPNFNADLWVNEGNWLDGAWFPVIWNA